MFTELLRGKWEGQGKSCVEILNRAMTMDFSLPPGVLKNICHPRSEHCLLSQFFYNGTQNTHLWFLRQRCEELHPTLSASDQFRLSTSISKRVRPGQSNTASWIGVLRRLKMSANMQETHLSLQTWNYAYCIAAVLMVDIVSFGAWIAAKSINYHILVSVRQFNDTQRKILFFRCKDTV